MGAGKLFGRPAARRVLVALVAVLLFGGWFAAFGVLLTARPRATLFLGQDYPSHSFSPDSKLLATWGLAWGPIHVWDAAGNKLLSVADGWDSVGTVLFSPDSTLLAAYQTDGDLKVWDIGRRTERSSLRPATKAEHFVHFSFTPDSKYIVLQDYGPGFPPDHVRFLDTVRLHERGVLDTSLWSLEFSPHDHEFTAWEPLEGKTIVRMRRWRYGEDSSFFRLINEGDIAADWIARSPDQTLIAALRFSKEPRKPTNVAIRDSQSQRVLCRFSIEKPGWFDPSLEFSPDEQLVAVHTADTPGKTTFLWDVSQEKPVQVGYIKNRSLFALGGKRVVEPVNCGAELYTSRPLQKLATLKIVGDEMPPVIGFGPNRDALVSCSPDGRFIIVDGLAHQQEERSWLLDWISEHVYNLPSSRTKASCGVVRVWDAETGREYASFDDCWHAVLSPDSRTLAAFHPDGSVALWDVPIKTAFNSWWTITAAALAATVVSLATLLAATKRLSRRTAKPAEAGPAVTTA